MIAFDIDYNGRNIRVEGNTRISAQYESEVVDILKGQIISTSRQFLKTEQDAGDFPKQNFLTLVDNKLNSDETDVKPFGSIVYRTKLQTLRPVLLFAMQALVERSPERRGAYVANHVLFKNNVFVAKGFSNIISFINKEDNLKANDTYRFVNVSPYARKLERYRITKQTRGRYKGQNQTKGIKKGLVKGKQVTIPSGAYVLATRSVKNRFKELKQNIRFSFIPISPGTARQLDTSGKDTTGYVFAQGRANGRGAGRPYLYPSLTISAIGDAISFNRGFTERSNL